MQLLSICDFKFLVQYYYLTVAKTISSRIRSDIWVS
ncbi:unnamed protein product [Brassica napus]|uniref:(rape) hypothetical protein n=1 Tax=Brassica napus TaxID=3708 RepID=A0A816YZH6_BRANA|nr:unnamed protein product [Brassica napus]